MLKSNKTLAEKLLQENFNFKKALSINKFYFKKRIIMNIFC